MGGLTIHSLFSNLHQILDNPEENHSQNNSHSTEANKTTNRLSVLSTESEKNSSASVDIISSSTECTSPGSDLLSLSTSSSSFGMYGAHYVHFIHLYYLAWPMISILLEFY